jgi:tetratricopeptide (TPR) repeat protein
MAAAKLKWNKFPHDAKAITYAGDALKKNWDALHKGDNEPYPKDATLQDAWRQYHAGNFAEAAELGEGSVVAAKATAIYATYLEKKDAAKVKLFQDAMQIADELRTAEPKNANAHYQYAYAAGRYSQSISIIKALKEGYGGKIKTALETVLKLDPKHAEAHTAMGAYHAEIIDKVGSMVGKLTYGANKDTAVEHYEKALKLTPASPIAHIEYANGLLMLYGDKEMEKATKLYEKAAKMKGKDAMEVLDIEMAKEELED